MHSHFVFVCISQHGSAVSVGKVVVGCMLYYNNKWLMCSRNKDLTFMICS